MYEKCTLDGPSISFNVLTKPINLLQDLHGNVENQDNQPSNSEATTQEADEYLDEITEEATTTTTEPPKKKSYNKRKRFFKVA